MQKRKRRFELDQAPFNSLHNAIGVVRPSLHLFPTDLDRLNVYRLSLIHI